MGWRGNHQGMVGPFAGPAPLPAGPACSLLGYSWRYAATSPGTRWVTALRTTLVTEGGFCCAWLPSCLPPAILHASLMAMSYTPCLCQHYHLHWSQCSYSPPLCCALILAGADGQPAHAGQAAGGAAVEGGRTAWAKPVPLPFCTEFSPPPCLPAWSAARGLLVCCYNRCSHSSGQLVETEGRGVGRWLCYKGLT